MAEMYITEREFKALLRFIMASDPTPLDRRDESALLNFANRESLRRGYSGWVEAFHEMGD